MYSAHARTSHVSQPLAPAFMNTAPPTVPGIPAANSNPPHPAVLSLWPSVLKAYPLPARRLNSSSLEEVLATEISSQKSSSFAMTNPSYPLSSNNTFEPLPITKTLF